MSEHEAQSQDKPEEDASAVTQTPSSKGIPPIRHVQ